MIIVLIFWHIKEDLKDDFFNYWKTQARIEDRADLSGEFLSSPIPQKDLKFNVQILDEDGDQNVQHFVNVGIWKNEQSFQQQVGRYMNDNNPIQPFEARRRTRMVLEPKHWRAGKWQIPCKDSAGVI